MEQNQAKIEGNASPMKPQGADEIEPDRKFDLMRHAVKKNLNRKIQFMLNSCVNCGL